jgi:dolichol-phosphate mannosyltransferase
MRRVLLTGGTGFVGANLARRLLGEGAEVHLLVREDHAAWRLHGIASDVRLHQADIRSGDDVGRCVAAVRPEWVFHLAAYGAYSWQGDAQRIVQTDIVGTVNLLEASLRQGVAAFVNAGSSSEYGLKDHAPAEDEWLDPNSLYGVAKASATQYCRYAGVSRQAPVTTLRLYSVYGPWEDPRRLVPALVTHGLEGKLPPLVSPDTARDLVHVDDATGAFLLAAASAAQHPGEVFNVGSGEQVTVRAVVEAARTELRIAAQPEWGTMQARSWDASTWVADCRRIARELGWRPRVTVRDGLRGLAEWIQADPARLAHYRRATPGSASGSSSGG